MQALGTHGRFDHPLLHTRGWWRRPARFHFPAVGAGPDERMTTPEATSAPAKAGERKPLLIVGGKGTLGRAFARLCTERGIDHVALSRSDLDIADGRAVRRLLEALHPWAVINAAGYVRVDEAEADCDRCLRENTIGAQHLAAACQRREIRFLTYSSDLVFNGAQAEPYLESDPVAPLNVYGRSKAEAERLVSQAMPSALIIRTSAFFGPWDSYNFVANVLGDLMEGRSVRAGAAVVSPTYVPDLVHATLDLIIDDEQGLWHVANQGAVSWSHLARTTATMAGFDHTLVKECDASELGWAAPRPGYSALGSERGVLLPAWEQSLERYLHERREEVARGRAACV
jgi:dTDP-4-dehydrorhamnose reductase